MKEAEISSWDDIDRIDIRPDKGIAKIRSKNNWEIQLDLESSEIYSVNFRRSDIIFKSPYSPQLYMRQWRNGRRTGFRYQRGNSWGFKSLLAHQKLT